VDEIAAASSVDPWFIDQMGQVWELARALGRTPLAEIGRDKLLEAKRAGLSDARIARETASTESDVRARRESLGVVPVFKSVDTCGGEFPARTPYHYSTYEEESEVRPASRPRVVILGAGPNRIGQGIEFDYACVHAAFALDEAGFESVMINSNPETVSTDYDTASRLYFEPLTAEDVLAVCRAEDPVGVIAQFGGQTPLELARILQGAGFRILGTSPDAIDLAEDRGRFAELLQEMQIAAPPHGEARTIDEARVVARRIGYPVVVRPSYVLGGRAMEIVHEQRALEPYMREAVKDSNDSRM
jgi:carbamoyl-phosphate synthase large subunit